MQEVNNIVLACIRENHFRSSDIAEVIHLVDTDGAFIQDSSVVYGKSLKYTDTVIETPYPEQIRQRNHQKSANIQRLLGKARIGRYPYSMYFMSVNLDHVLYNVRNLCSAEKENLAFEFADRYYDENEMAISFLCKSDFSMNGDYLESWKYIQQNGNSLQRCTNFSICIQNKLNTNSVNSAN